MTMSTIGGGGGIGTVKGGHSDVPNILMEFGIGRYNAQMVAQYVFMIPRTTDPDSQGVIMLVQAVQRGLQRLGAPVEVSGILDQATVDGLRRVSGLFWHGKTWLQILGDLSSAIQKRMYLGPQKAVGEYVETSGIEISTGSAFFLMIGSYFLYRALKRS